MAYQKLILEYLKSLPEGSKVAILSENMSYYYSHVKRMLEKCPNNISSLVIICTANAQDHNSKRYLLDRYPELDEILILEKTSDYKMAAAIYDKLDEKSHLNKLITYGDSRKVRIKHIQELNDIIEVLYVSHEGRGFINHFSDWIANQSNDANKDGFLFLCFLECLGVPSLTKPLFRDILASCGISIDVPTFLDVYKDLVHIEKGRLSLRCSRLLWTSAQQQIDKQRVLQWIEAAVSLLARNLREREDSIQNEIFQKLIKTKELRRQLDIPVKDIVERLIKLQSVCKHLSYYWVQRGICHREQEDFEEANNAFLEASKIRNNTSFHIKHAQAKNYMAWGVWALAHQPSHAIYFFSQGREMLEQLIQDAPSRYYPYSIHTYVDMMLRYHRTAKIRIDEDTLRELGMRLQMLIESFDDPMTEKIVKHFLDYCEQIGVEPLDVQDLRALYVVQFKKHQLVRWDFSTTFDTDDLDD